MIINFYNRYWIRVKVIFRRGEIPVAKSKNYVFYLFKDKEGNWTSDIHRTCISLKQYNYKEFAPIWENMEAAINIKWLSELCSLNNFNFDEFVNKNNIKFNLRGFKQTKHQLL